VGGCAEEGTVELYDHPEWYEVALQQPNEEIATEVAFVQTLFSIHSHRKVWSVLDIACGPCPHSLGLAEAGFAVAGLDISEAMLSYAKKKAQDRGLMLRCFRADMRAFDLDETFDAAICTHESIHLLLSNEEYRDHFLSVARCLRAEGLYYIVLEPPGRYLSDLLRQKDSTLERYFREEKQLTDARLSVEKFSSSLDLVSQVYTWGFKCRIVRGERIIELEHWALLRVLMVQEFRSLVEASMVFDLVEFYGDFDIDSPLTSNSPRWIAILRRREKVNVQEG